MQTIYNGVYSMMDGEVMYTSLNCNATGMLLSDAVIIIQLFVT